MKSILKYFVALSFIISFATPVMAEVDTAAINQLIASLAESSDADVMAALEDYTKEACSGLEGEALAEMAKEIAAEAVKAAEANPNVDAAVVAQGVASGAIKSIPSEMPDAAKEALLQSVSRAVLLGALENASEDNAAAISAAATFGAVAAGCSEHQNGSDVATGAFTGASSAMSRFIKSIHKEIMDASSRAAEEAHCDNKPLPRFPGFEPGPKPALGPGLGAGGGPPASPINPSPSGSVSE